MCGNPHNQGARSRSNMCPVSHSPISLSLALHTLARHLHSLVHILTAVHRAFVQSAAEAAPAAAVGGGGSEPRRRRWLSMRPQTTCARMVCLCGSLGPSPRFAKGTTTTTLAPHSSLGCARMCVGRCACADLACTPTACTFACGTTYATAPGRAQITQIASNS